MRTKLWTTACATAWAMVAAPLAAQDVTAADPDSVLAATRAYGHKARMDTDEGGLPVIRARLDDINYGIYFYDCDGPTNCSQLQLAASFDLDPGLSPEFANDWNEQWAIGRLSVNADGDPLFTYFLTTRGGLSQASFTAVLDIWSAALRGIVDDIGY